MVGMKSKSKKTVSLSEKAQKLVRYLQSAVRFSRVILMSDYMIERFKLFSLQWLKYGKSFVSDLDNSMMSKFVEVHRQINLAKVARCLRSVNLQ